MKAKSAQGEQNEGEGRLYTLGHSNRPLDEFLTILFEAGIRSVVDVRRHPGSRTNPHFGREHLAATLASSGVEYSSAPALGGRRRSEQPSPNTAWENPSFRAYADYMATAEFLGALAELTRRAAVAPTVIICAEAQPERCHRRLIADAATLGGFTVVHLLGPRRSRVHGVHPAARLRSGVVVYPA
jgi:uncharacterized protein (DUF488 family)